MQDRFPYELYKFCVPNPKELPAEAILKYFPRRNTRSVKSKMPLKPEVQRNRVDAFIPSAYKNLQPLQLNSRNEFGQPPLPLHSAPSVQARPVFPSIDVKKPKTAPAQQPLPKPKMDPLRQDLKIPMDVENVHTRDPGMTDVEENCD